MIHCPIPAKFLFLYNISDEKGYATYGNCRQLNMKIPESLI